MSMHSVFLKEHEEVDAVGSQPPPVVYGGEGFIGSTHQLDLSAAPHFCANSKPESQLHHFTLFSPGGDCKSGEKTPLPAQAATVDYRGHFELGFGQPLICRKIPYPEQCYGIYSTYGTTHQGRMMLPADGSGPIFVNAKQYNAIMRRRKKRAEAEIVNKLIKNRKPYLHLSRHLHAMRRPRGNGGRFLNTKTSNLTTAKTRPKERGGNHTKIFEMLQSDGSNSNGSTSPGSDDSCSDMFSRGIDHHHHPFEFNNLVHAPSPYHHFSDAGLGIGMVTGNNYLKV